MSVKQDIIDSMKSLPPMSATTNKIMSLIGLRDVNIADVVQIIHYDPALTGNVLRLVNSAYFGLRTDVTSLRQAVILLGLNQIYRIVIAVSFSSLMSSAVRGYELKTGELWKHSVASAIASENIAKTIHLKDFDLLFTAALLHDIGKIALASFVDRYYSAIEEELSTSGDPFEIVEKKIFGIDHAQAGALILRNWGIPKSLYLPVLWHHDPEACDQVDITQSVDVVHVADSLCLAAGIGVGRDGLQYRPSANVLMRLNCRISTLEGIISKTMSGLDELNDIF